MSKSHLRNQVIAFFCLLLGPQLHAEKAYEKVAEKKLFNGEKVFEYRLQNEMRVVIVPRHQAEVLTYQIWFRVGSVDEKLDPKLRKTGLAHLFEHMMFRGTEKHPDGIFDKLISKMGGTAQNATTFFYRTNYFESIPSRNLEKLMELEADRMANLKITKDLFEKEKGAVVGELRRALDNPVRVGYDSLQKLMYRPQSPYRYTVLGTETEIKGFSLEEANYFYRTFYAPNNATLFLIGDVNPEEAMELVVKYYGDMKPQAIPSRKREEEPEQTKKRSTRTAHSQSTSETLIMAYPGPAVESNDIVSLSLLATHLSTGNEARLAKLLVDTGIAVSAHGSPGSQPDMFDFVVQMSQGHKAAEAVQIIEKEIEDIKTNGIAQESFKRALNQELLDLYEGIDDNSRLGRMFGEYLMLSDNYMRGFEIIQAYKKLTPEDLQAAAKKYFQSNKQNIVVIHPK